MTIEERIKDIEELKKEIRDLCEKLPDAYLNQTFDDLRVTAKYIYGRIILLIYYRVSCNQNLIGLIVLMG